MRHNHFYVVAAWLLFGLIGLSEARAANFHLGYYDGSTSITIVGPIVKGDAARFRETLKSVADRNFTATHVYLYTPGGSVDEAIQIGRMISKLAISTVVPSYDASTNGPLSCTFRISKTETDYRDISWTYDRRTGQGDRRCNCASACFLIWAGGARRDGNYLGVHRTFYKPDIFKKDDFQTARDRYRKMRHIVEDYLDEMNVPNLVVDTMFSVPSAEIQPLKQEFVSLMQGGAAFDEYMRAFCPKEAKERDFAKRNLDKLRASRKQLATMKKGNPAEKAAIDIYKQASDEAYYCEIKVRQRIFKEAWAKM